MPDAARMPGSAPKGRLKLRSGLSTRRFSLKVSHNRPGEWTPPVKDVDREADKKRR